MMQKSKSINLFATKDDWSRLLAAIESQLAVAYVQEGNCAEMPRRLESYKNIENLGVACFGNTSSERIYLCFDGATEIQIRSVEQKSGRHANSVDQRSNPDTVVLKPGGKFSGNFVIAGQIGTISDTDWSLRAFSIFQKEIRRQFEKVKSYYVGEEARSLLDEGYRLTANTRSPEEYDLSLA